MLWYIPGMGEFAHELSREMRKVVRKFFSVYFRIPMVSGNKRKRRGSDDSDWVTPDIDAVREYLKINPQHVLSDQMSIFKQCRGVSTTDHLISVFFFLMNERMSIQANIWERLDEFTNKLQSGTTAHRSYRPCLVPGVWVFGFDRYRCYTLARAFQNFTWLPSSTGLAHPRYDIEWAKVME